MKKYINARLTDQYLQSWYAYIDNSSKASNYSNIRLHSKHITILENKYWCSLIRFKLSNHNLPIETGRWENVTIQNRICPLCNNVDIEDEFHYIFTCTFFKNERHRFLPSFCQSKPNIYKLLKLFNSKKAGVLRRLSIFCNLIMNCFQILWPEPFPLSSQCSTTGVTNAAIRAILSGMMHIKRTL